MSTWTCLESDECLDSDRFKSADGSFQLPTSSSFRRPSAFSYANWVDGQDRSRRWTQEWTFVALEQTVSVNWVEGNFDLFPQLVGLGEKLRWQRKPRV